MSEEQNDSPAFRLRPRRAAPKSYYTVRLEYSANPAAFIRERPRGPKRKVFSQKIGSNSTKTAPTQTATPNVKFAILTKEEREREEKRNLLHRNISESITKNTLISPFIERLQLGELEPDSVYEHNYITLRIKEVDHLSTKRLSYCLCESVGEFDLDSCVGVYLYDEYADATLLKPDKIISIAKFRTGLTRSTEVTDSAERLNECPSPGNSNGHQTGHERVDLKPPTQQKLCNIERDQSPSACVKREPTDPERFPHLQDPNSGIVEHSTHRCSLIIKHETTLPFDVIVKYEELVERSTSNSNRGSSTTSASSIIGGASVNRRPLIPFVSITDMIDQPTEPFVEMPLADSET